MFEVLEHTADIGFRATAATLPELFEAAAEALVAIVLDPANIAARETIELAHDPMEGTLGFLNRAFRVVLTLPLQTLVVFDEFLSEELSDADAKRSAQRLDYAWRLDTRNPTFRGHFNRGYLPV